MTLTSHSPIVVRREVTSRLPAIAGVVFAAAWAIGLAIQPSGPALDASSRELARHYADHGTAAALQSVFVHGFAALALAVVAVGVARAVREREPRAARVVRVSGLSAASLSGVQMIAGVLAATTVGATDTGRASVLFEVVSRLDGFKMLALAVMAAGGLVLARRNVLAPWLGWVAALLIVALVPSALGYLLMNATVAIAAAPALLLLVVWVCGAGITSGRR